jgi:hypothetical protein
MQMRRVNEPSHILFFEKFYGFCNLKLKKDLN